MIEMKNIIAPTPKDQAKKYERMGILKLSSHGRTKKKMKVMKVYVIYRIQSKEIICKLLDLQRREGEGKRKLI